MLAEGNSKCCSSCKKRLPIASFHKNRTTKDGLQPRCRDCAHLAYRKKRESLGFEVKDKVYVPSGHKLCPKCKKIRPYVDWNRNRTSSDGYSARCKDCLAEDSREGHLKRTYGMTMADRHERLNLQFDRCPICWKPDPEHVDHDHKTGKVRGILCFNCNGGLGQFRDDPAALRRAAEYLEGQMRWIPVTYVLDMDVYPQHS